MSAAPALDETPAAPGEWGFRPDDSFPSQTTPPGFSWRPQSGAAEYALEVSRTPDFATVEYRADGIAWNVHCPPRTLESGNWHWRFRYRNQDNEWSAWSQVRPFAIAEDASELPLPAKEDLVARIPKQHPRLFVRPEWIPEMRQRAQGDLKPLFDSMVENAERALANPPPTAEPERYPEGMQRGSDPWRTIWWGNRVYVQRSLGVAAELAFTRLLGGKEEYGELARKILLDAAQWDPKGATGYRYNDEAGMPYNYFFSRTYTFLHDMLTEEERELCRQVMAIRGDEMFRHLAPRHLWRPYGSHSNRAWHFLGEIGIAFHGEIPEADEWTWFAANVFANAYPVWSDADGGWHEGSAYWNSYIARFTWWADVMRAALDIDAFRKPYFSQVGYYTMYLAPPGTLTGGFGDLAPPRAATSNRGLMTVLAAQAGNPHWQWYVNAIGGPAPTGGYVGFVRGALPEVEAQPPDDLPTSRLFRGTGLAFLNSDLADGVSNVAVRFKASPFGTQSHGYEAQNAFLLHVHGERMFIRSGRRDSYGSDHHRNWMWHTKSVNSITINGTSQGTRTAAAVGEITGFQTTRDFDYVAGQAAPAYPKGLVDDFTRRILFIKPDAVVIWDTLATPEPASFEWHLHARNEMAQLSPNTYRAVQNQAACLVEFLEPQELQITQTDQFDPPPRPRIKLVEYHLTAVPPEKTRNRQFVTVLRPHSADTTLDGASAIQATDRGHLVTIPMPDGGQSQVLLNPNPGANLALGGIETSAEAAVVRTDSQGRPVGQFVVGDTTP